MLFVNDDYLKSEKGSRLSEYMFATAIRTTLGLKDNTCSICMDLIKGYTPSGRPDNIIIDCGHMFHIECFDSHWKACDEAKNTVRCPNCREPYKPAVRDGRHAQLVGNSADAQDLIDTVTHGVGNM